MLNQIVEILRLSEDSEEEVVVSNGTVDLMAFASAMPYCRIGQTWEVALTVLVLGEYKVCELDENAEERIRPLEGGYCHSIVGRLQGETLLSCGYAFHSSAFETEYLYLNERMISIEVDRIDIEFLNRVNG